MKLLSKKSNILILLFTKNNLICTITNLEGNILTWLTAGSLKNRGAKKNNECYAFFNCKKIEFLQKKFGYTHTHVKLKGINKNKNFFIKYLKTIGFNIVSLKESAVLAHNGCKKTRNRKI
uniref:Ribosomal protein S11 n=1 Tax=Lithothamnion sp. TaxID=1940749 RepID=A0A3G3MIB4_9FLOR|nr:ribosomal protein S11 [Lithothamnion sp.]